MSKNDDLGIIVKDENGNILEDTTNNTRLQKSIDASVKSTVLLSEAHADLNPDAGFVRNIKGIGKGLFGILKSFESNYHNGNYDEAITTTKNITKKVATGIVEQGLNNLERHAKNNPNFKDPDSALNLVEECRDKLNDFK